MTTNEPRFESEMLRRVRQWRKEAYEESRQLTREERAKKVKALAAELGLRIEAPADLERRRSA